MSILVARLVVGIGIAVATTVIRREVNFQVKGRGEMQTSLQSKDGDDAKAVHFAAGGSMVFTDDNLKSKREFHVPEVELQRSDDDEETSDAKDDAKRVANWLKSGECGENGDVCPEMCDDDFPLGVAGTNDCAETLWHHRMDNPFMCSEAAKMANASLTDLNEFSIPPEYGHLRPQGCFVTTCSVEQNPNGECYFWNNDPEEAGPDTTDSRFEGTPVCVRYKFRNGTIKADAPNGVECPAGYQHIIKENNCSLAATCEGSCHANPFIVREEDRDKYPLGCFMHNVIGCYMFNPLTNSSGETWPLPTAPAGYPLCNVTSVTHYPPINPS